jgi:HSP20 family molecular chaperone IbpA
MLINNKENMNSEINLIRHHFDEKSGELFFSIIDTIDNLDLSKDPRNYWKVLKSRLKNTHNQLVTECNQLKLRANDGKYYLTDVTKVGNLLQIIQLIAPEKVSEFEEIFNKIARKSEKNINVYNDGENEEKKISTVFFEDGEIQVDMYQKENCIFVNTMIAGVEPQDIFISVTPKILTLKVSRLNENIDDNYLNQELYWGKFSRVLELPFEVDIDRVETHFSHGLLFIKLYILDKTRTKIIKVK